MNHPIYQVRAVEIVEPYTLRVQFTETRSKSFISNRFLQANSMARCSISSCSTEWPSTRRSKLWCGRTAPISILRHCTIGPSTKTPSPPAPENGNASLLDALSRLPCQQVPAACLLPRLFQIPLKPLACLFRHLFQRTWFLEEVGGAGDDGAGYGLNSRT
jgi:hypothetical protein